MRVCVLASHLIFFALVFNLMKFFYNPLAGTHTHACMLTPYFVHTLLCSILIFKLSVE